MISAAWPRSASSLARARAAAVLPEAVRSEEHTSELQSHLNLVCRLLLETEEHTSELQSHLKFVCRLLLETKEAQGKLLRALETGEVQPLGATAKRRIDLRVVSADQEDLRSGLEGGRFRRDLYQRVAGLVIELPALAARPEDILPLAEHFAQRGGRRLGPH